MRAPLFGPLAASSLLGLSLAQAPEYGQRGTDTPSDSGDKLSDGASNTPSTCYQHIATTVFVTVFPTSPTNPSDGSQQDDLHSVQTITETLPPTTVFLSAAAPDASSFTTFVSDGAPGDPDATDGSALPSSAPDSSPASGVEPFTTLTIDIWGDGTGQGSDPTQVSTGLGPSSVATNSIKPPPGSTDSTDRSGGDANDTDPLDPDSGDGDESAPTAYGPTDGSSRVGSGDPSPTTQDDAYPPTTPSTWYTVVTDSDVYWTTGPAGPSQITILLSHTLTLDGSIPTASDSDGADDTGGTGPQNPAVTGSDGNPAVTVESSNSPHTGDGPSSQHAACTKTVTGADGRTTIIIGGPFDDDSSGDQGHRSGVSTLLPLTDSGLSFPSTPAGYPGDSGVPTQGASDGNPRGTYTTFTSFGTDGLPTIVESALPFPRPSPAADAGSQSTLPSLPGHAGATGTGSFPTISPNDSSDGSGITTAFTFTFDGANGPTAVESTVVIFPTPQGSEALSALPTQFQPSPGASNGSPGPSTGITTCFTYTVIGSDGLPTIIDSTVVLTPTGGLNDGSYPTPTIPSLPNASQGLPVPGGSPITTSFRHTFTGADGYPTVLETTLVVTPTNFVPGPSNVFPNPVLTAGPFSGLPTGIPAFTTVDSNQKAAPITTCATFTFIGADGLPTVTEHTWTTTGPIPATTAQPWVITPPFGVPGVPTPGVPGLPEGGAGQTTCTTFTIIGADGLPTVTEASWIVPGSGVVQTPAPFPQIPGGASNAIPSGADRTIHTTFTVIGADGLPTVTEAAWTFPGSGITQTPAPFPQIPQIPGGAGDGLPSGAGQTTCATFTVIGADGLPTVTEASWILPGSGITQTPLPFPQVPGGAGNGLPSGVPSQISGIPGLPQGPGSPNDPFATITCTSCTLLGADGMPTVVETTWTVPVVGSVPTPTSLAFPSAVTPVTNLPPGIPTGGNAVTTSFTAFTIGTDGQFTPIVQTIVFTPGAIPPTAGIPFPTGPIVASSAMGVPGLSQYGSGASNTEAGVPAFPPGFTPILTDGGALPISGVLPPLVTGTITGTRTATFTATALPGIPGAPDGLPPSYGDPSKEGSGNSGLPGSDNSGIPGSDNSGLPGSAPPYNGAFPEQPSELTLWPSSIVYGVSAGNSLGASTPCGTTLRTSTWTNVIPEQTTTYTLNYPLTTLVTLSTPAVIPGEKRVFRRQEFAESSLVWTNSSAQVPTPSPENTIGASLSSIFGDVASTPVITSETTTPPAPVTPTPSPARTPVCSTGGNVGNYTLNFDELQPGPLYNPAGDFWFSEGFSVVPPSEQAASFSPSSGGQLLEFTPLSVSQSSSGGSADTAEFGVGPHFASSCFKFDLYGLSLGCAAEGNEQWCEFEFSAYAFDESSGGAQSTSWSETKRIPACPDYPTGGCTLTPVELFGYTNITSVLITLRVGLDVRVWWGDDLRVGWTDNSCEAGHCRSDISLAFAKRERSGLPFRDRLSRFMTPGLKMIRETVG